MYMNVFLSVYIFCFYSQNGFTNRFLKNIFDTPDGLGKMKNKHSTLPVVKQIKIMYLHQTVDRDIFHNNSDINNIGPNLTPEVAALLRSEEKFVDYSYLHLRPWFQFQLFVITVML